MRRFTTWRRLAILVLLVMAVSVTALVRAAQSTSILSLIATAPLSGQAAAAKAHLTGPEGEAFAKAWDEEMKGRDAVLKEARDAVAALAEGDPHKGMDRAQTALTHLMDDYARSCAKLAKGLSEEQQARMSGGGSLYTIARMKGMKDALPELVDYAAEALLKKSGMDDAARAKLHPVRTKHLARAMALIYDRAQLKTQLGDPAKRGAALAAMEKNHREMAEEVADGLKELRRDVPDEQSAKMLLAFSGRLSDLVK